MTSSPAQPGSDCVDCRAKRIITDARRCLTLDDGKRINLCLNHAAAHIHQANIFDATLNPTGNK